HREISDDSSSRYSPGSQPHARGNSSPTFWVRRTKNGRPGPNFHNRSSPSRTHHKEAFYAKTLLPKRHATHPADSLIHAHSGSAPSKKTLKQEKDPAGGWQ